MTRERKERKREMERSKRHQTNVEKNLDEINNKKSFLLFLSFSGALLLSSSRPSPRTRTTGPSSSRAPTRASASSQPGPSPRGAASTSSWDAGTPRKRAARWPQSERSPPQASPSPSPTTTLLCWTFPLSSLSRTSAPRCWIRENLCTCS